MEFEPLEDLPVQQGGTPKSEDDLKLVGLDFSQCIDAGQPLPGGGYAPLARRWVDKLVEVSCRWHEVWARDAKAPRISRLVVIDIPTGDHAPISQKPYGIPYKYMDAVRKEIQKLLDAGLIEPGISNWASPMLITVKKDSKPGDLRIKIICDFRRLNAITIPDTGGLGNQDEILMGFGDGQHYTGIVDAAGGFYSFCIRPSDRIKTNFVLPVSMGGTSFVWSVAPYGLTRNPAGYSRAVMFTLHGLSEVELAPLGQSHGGVRSWLDDITMRADSIAGFVDLFERVLRRLVAGGISLKGEKCHLLRENLEILGFLQTLTGLKMQPDKTDALRRMRPPTTKSEVQTYLGAVNFYRRFVPRIALLAAPMSAMLKKGGTYDQGAVEQAFGAINMFLTSDALLSPPDLRDQLAEYVICTDASNVAAGGVLMQWQHPNKSGERGPPDGIPFRGEAGKDPITHSWRLDAGWLLRTIAYYSKTFDSAQRNYCTFDKESSAIFLCCRHWSNLITGCWTTIYTDSSVAASMLTKHQGPPRLQRWGMELEPIFLI